MSSKRCFKCLRFLPLSEFYAHSMMKDGHLNKCKDCTKADVVQHRLEKIEHYRSYDRARASAPHRVAARKAYQETLAGKLAVARAKRKWAVAHATRRDAATAVGNAIRDGRLERQPCFVCGDKAQAHHPDYSAPLAVSWLCARHHAQLHKEHRAAEREKAESRIAA